ncbi:MAG: midcut-by-XrtH protein [Haliea sp.]|nr:MAG: midcut-by-XrtH protein [Haliea sp.]
MRSHRVVCESCAPASRTFLLASRVPQSVCAVLLAGAAGSATAQSITSALAAAAPGTLNAVPVNGAFALALMAAAMAGAAMWFLRKTQWRAHLSVLLAALVVAGGLWGSPSLWAQVVAQFTQPNGETLPIAVVPIVVGGNLQGFQPADFTNATPVALRIAALDPPDLASCFPGGPTYPVPAPTGGAGPAACAVGLSLAAGATCRVDVDAICKALAVQAQALISVAPSSLTFSVNAAGAVTVTNGAGSPAAQNVAATIPAGSNLSVQSSTCGASLAAGASCVITLTGAVPEGPTTVAVKGSNTAAQNVSVTVAPRPTISITGPAQGSRVIAVGSATPLALVVTNDAASSAAAVGITVVDKTAAPNVVVDDSNCTSVAPGASCTLLLTSSTAYAPATLAVGGSNTANTPNVLVAFSYLGGLVFEESGGAGKIVIDAAQQFASQWTGSNASVGAGSTTDGAANTNTIIADPSCSNAPASCAAQRCRDIGADWYLPALNELSTVRAALCPSGAGCNFSGFTGTHSTSTESSTVGVRLLLMPAGTTAVGGKAGSFTARCIRAF